MNVWVWAINEENWPTVKSEKTWAVDTEIKSKKVQKGDIIVFYVKAEPKSYCFQGIYEVVSDWHSPTLKWEDRETVLEVNLRKIQTGFADVRKIEDRLEFIKQRKNSRGYLGLALKASSYGPSNNSTPISESDYKVILGEISLHKSEPPLGDDVKTEVEPPDSKTSHLKNAPVRLHLVKSLFENLIGPKMGPGEEIENPSYSYVVGVLRSKFKRDEQPKQTDPADKAMPESRREDANPSDELEDEKILDDYDLNPVLGARSIGLSFVVRGNLPKAKMCFTWGRYVMSPIATKLWRRESNFYVDVFDFTTKIQNIILNEGISENKRITRDGVEIRIHSAPISNKPDEFRVSIFLINNTTYDGYHQSTAEYVFQPQIRVNCIENTTLVDLGNPDSDEEANENLMYLERRNFGHGHFCGVMWNEVDPEDPEQSEVGFSSFTWADSRSKHFPQAMVHEFTRPSIRTEFFPTYSILQPDLSEKSNTNFDAEQLSEIWDSRELAAFLGKIVNKYTLWIANQNDALKKKSMPEKLQKVAEQNLEKCEKSLNRISNGIKFLETDEKARAAFCFMNKVIAVKSKWENRDRLGAKPFEWWEFQMAFILQCIRGVAQNDHEDNNLCDVLWFPTGGGKTEAYLGLTAFSICYRRLQTVDGLNTDGGVSVISRYTLRLLTIQQFQRSVGAIVAADFLRSTGWKPKNMKPTNKELLKKIENGHLWGKSRFSIGIWIGGSATPNRFQDEYSRHSKTKILHAEGMLRDNKPVGSQAAGEPAQVFNCPCCGSILAIPTSELSNMEEKTHTIYWIFRTHLSLSDLDKIPGNSFTGNEVQSENIGKKIFQIGTSGGPRGTKYYCMRIMFKSRFPNIALNGAKINSWWNIHVSQLLGSSGTPAVLESTAASRPGYFYATSGGEIYDFAIHCPNPECELNQIPWSEDLSCNASISVGNPFKIPNAEQKSLFMPLSAYTVDEQIYRRCPTMLISTVDKFAMIPYFPEAGKLFGNVDTFHRYKGYGRDGITDYGENTNSQDISKLDSPFYPPSLIIQDELHLIEGPLGSLFGVYELATDILLRSNKSHPKYVASSATIKEAKSQVGTIFRRDVSIFPPPGISIDDNYFSENEEDRKSNSEKAGRLYLGICAPTKILTIPVRIWAILLSEVYKIRKNPYLYGLHHQYEKSGFSKIGRSFIDFVTEQTDPYWTLVGYFNAIKELQIARSLYGDDITRDVKTFSSQIFSSITYRLQNVRLRPAMRFIPIRIPYECTVEKISVYTQNQDGQISVVMYDNKSASSTPGKILRKVTEEDRVKKCTIGENEFKLEQPYLAKADETLWIGIVHTDDGTRFHTGSSESQSYCIQMQKKDIDHVIEEYGFVSDPMDIEKENATIRVSVSTSPRRIGFEPIELTGQTDSQDLPHILKDLNKTPSDVDSVFTTAVFGTGIDIPRLGLMVVMGQPKTTSSYIQSTGRVGRRIGGLVITWLKASNVRDLNHYENFVGYHRMLHRYVEPVSASPYSEDALRLCLGPVCVGIIRNASMIGNASVRREWVDRVTGPIRMATNMMDEEIKMMISELKKMTTDSHIPDTRRPSVKYASDKIDNTINNWEKDAINIKNERENLVYNQWTMQDPPSENVILGTLQHEVAKFIVVYKNARTSMREVESAANFGE